MINALMAPRLKMPSVRESFSEPIMRQNALAALGLAPSGYGINPGAPGLRSQPQMPDTFAIQPTGGMASTQGSGDYSPATGGAGVAPGQGMANFQPAYGGRRPNPAGPEVMQAVQLAAADVFGPDATVIGVSGTGEHGSVRHRASASGRDTGHALDLRVRLGDGTELTLDDPRARDFALAAARRGVTGLGGGSEYMGDKTFHMDDFPVSQYTSGMGRAWGVWGDQIENDFVAAFGG